MMTYLRRLVPTGAWARAVLVPALVFMALATDRNYLTDFWHHLARGRVMAAEGRLVDEDRFTFTVPGRPFQDVNWLSQLAYHGLFELGGLDLVRCVNALLLAAALALVTWHCWRASGSLGAAVAVAVLTFFGLWNVLTIRPQTFSLLLFAGLYAALDGAERRPWLLWLGPPVLALWANLHGAFPAGLMLIGCFLAAAVWRAWRRPADGLQPAGFPILLALCLGASLLATLANPYGWGIYRYVGLTSNTAALRRIDEWVPPGLGQWIGIAFFVSLPLLAGLVLAAWRRGRGLAAHEVCLIACFLPLACGSVRMVAWWLLAIAPMLASRLAVLWPSLADAASPPERPSVGAAAIFGVIVLAVLFCLPGLQGYNPLLRVSRQGPRVEDDLEAVHRHLRARTGAGRVFSRFEWGEYLTWACAPDFKVFMDGRIEIYPDEVWTQYGAVTCGQDNWEHILDTYRVDYLLLDADYHRRTGLLGRVAGSRAWREEFRAGGAVLYARR
jgi:hypothetical protein